MKSYSKERLHTFGVVHFLCILPKVQGYTKPMRTSYSAARIHEAYAYLILCSLCFLSKVQGYTKPMRTARIHEAHAYLILCCKDTQSPCVPHTLLSLHSIQGARIHEAHACLILCCKDTRSPCVPHTLLSLFTGQSLGDSFGQDFRMVFMDNFVDCPVDRPVDMYVCNKAGNPTTNVEVRMPFINHVNCPSVSVITLSSDTCQKVTLCEEIR